MSVAYVYVMSGKYYILKIFDGYCIHNLYNDMIGILTIDGIINADIVFFLDDKIVNDNERIMPNNLYKCVIVN